MISGYVTDKIDEAIKQGWIKVYYQPVIRSITGELCGFESLARWIDPEVGFLAPDKFIGTLEECRQIYKLDSYMIERVCHDIHDRFEAGLDMVPVSVNFSRLDFLMCDMLEIVEAAVQKYDVPRDYIHIEITESLMVSDGELMHRIIKSFRDKGYGVWMDDFGSGYSSLNTLKDFEFDVLKMDMKFLSSFTVKSKAIMKSLITMAKDIGIMTLAEGVETEEEVEFLKEIGCGRLQGYYFGKPEPLESTMEHLREKGIKIEERQWHHFYDIAAIHVRATDTPLEILEDDGHSFKTLFMNDAYKLQVFDDLPDIDETDKRIYHTGSPLLKQYREFANRMSFSKKPETFYYTAGSNYLCFKGREIAEHAGRHLYKGSILNITKDKDSAKKDDLDLKLRELNHLFAVVLWFNPTEEMVTPIIGKFRFYNGPEKLSMRKSTEMIANTAIHPSDRGRYLQFMEATTFAERINKQNDGYIEEAFRFKNFDGNYWWALATVMMLPGTGGKEFLYCVKPLAKTSSETILNYGNVADSFAKDDEFSLLWYNFVMGSTVKFYWKDKDRKYLGVSKAFLDYFCIEDESLIIGKTGKEMTWHINDSNYEEEERQVINSGKQLNNIQSQCIIRGVIHNTLSSKLPIYRNGEIVGLMGYIIDIDEERQRFNKNSGSNKLDKVTGVMNARSFVETMMGFIERRHELGRKYGLIVLKNRNYKRITDSYGKDLSNSVLQTTAEIILSLTNDTCVVSRTKESYFALMMNCDSRGELEIIAEQLRKSIDEINGVEGRSVTMKTVAAVRFSEDVGLVEEKIYESALDEIQSL